MSSTTRYAIALMVLLLVATSSVRAIEQIAIQIGNWSSEQIDITDLQVEVNLQTAGLFITATAKSVQLAEPFGRLSNVSLRCDSLRWLSGQIDCQAGQVEFTHQHWGNQTIAFKVQSRAEDDNYQITLNGIQLAQGVLNVQANYQQGKWQTQLAGQQISLSSLITSISPYISEQQQSSISQWNISAVADIDAELSGEHQQLRSATISGIFNNVTFSDATGRYVGENLAAQLQLKLHTEANNWFWQQTLTLDDGQAYFDPVFLDVVEQSIMIRSEGQFNSEDKRWQINDLWFEQNASVQANGKLQGQNTQLQNVQLDLNSSNLAQLYKSWLQPFFTGSSLSRLQTSGQVNANVQWQPNHYLVTMDLQSVSVADEAERFSIESLDGQLGWTNQPTVLPVAVSWQSASILKVPLGGSNLKAEVSQNQIQFTESLSLPILDGGLILNDFQLGLAEEQGVNWQFEGVLSPISMDKLSLLLGWPELQGKLSGMIPKVSYAKEQISVDGALLLKLFDGTTVIKDLRLQQPFGSLPQLYANIDINRLDLQTLTNTFDFGTISGKLNGQIYNLRLSNWQPVQFDALFETPDDDPGRRRISQRAVNNISQVGGGPSAILSRGFMGLFEDFSYKKIGLSCRLMNSVCQMDGIEPTEQGYYIVKGGGLPPWINVIGYTREVDWPELIGRLKAVSHSDGPVIQ
jgi:hypothetical protein